MKENTIFVKRYAEDDAVFPVNEQEIWRYSGYMGLAENVDEELKKLLEQVKQELKNAFSYKVCYRKMKLDWEDEKPELPFGWESKELAKCLKGCDEVVLFAATIGLEIDRYIARSQRLSPTKALLAQAYGAERVEALCDAFCKEMTKQVQAEGRFCTMRFSPGYGDLPLFTQTDMFSLLDCNRQIGISLNDSLLMSPSKSVTAIFGIGDEKQIQADKEVDARHTCGGNAKQKCASCTNVNCVFRRT